MSTSLVFFYLINPVFKYQVVHAFKMLYIVCDKRVIVHDAESCYQYICIFNWLAIFTNFSVYISGFFPRNKVHFSNFIRFAYERKSKFFAWRCFMLESAPYFIVGCRRYYNSTSLSYCPTKPLYYLHIFLKPV